MSMSDLSGRDLVEEILSRVPITSLRAVRLTCKQWNDYLSKDPSFTKNHYGKEAKEIMACLMSVNLHNHKDLADPSLKKIGKLNQVKISQLLFHCDGLLLLMLCNAKDKSRLMVWNPNNLCILDMFYMGYDTNNNHKILKFSSFHREYEIYDFKSNAWRVDVTTDCNIYRWSTVSLKGNAYCIAHEKLKRFGPRLPLPFHSCPEDAVILSTCDTYEMKIWITTKIEPNIVLWSNFLKVDMRLLTERFWFPYWIFFVDEKKKVAMICHIDSKTWNNYKSHMVGENGYYREVKCRKPESYLHMCSYVPSSVQI
ncbi:hypothetical protein ARALYDRAFT_495165, partial [Arabidopsis lyrata subsp. lyrata]